MSTARIPPERTAGRAPARFALALAAAAIAAAAWPLQSRAAGANNAPPPPINITADHGQFNNAKGVATYTGHVVLVRAQLTLTGEHLVVHRRDAQAPITAVLTGKPAHLHQATNARIQRAVRGTATTITYSGADGTVELTGNAVVHRGQDLLKADEVTYDLGSGEITASGEKSSQGRVHMILHPRQQGGKGGGS